MNTRWRTKAKALHMAGWGYIAAMLFVMCNGGMIGKMRDW